ncbi:MAG TPA: hypothetical protein VLU25_03510 [Acidobacteriota bacterium]|nr:hypothetical protein [Acidobacteriota bacterium]
MLLSRMESDAVGLADECFAVFESFLRSAGVVEYPSMSNDPYDTAKNVRGKAETRISADDGFQPLPAKFVLRSVRTKCI